MQVLVEPRPTQPHPLRHPTEFRFPGQFRQDNQCEDQGQRVSNPSFVPPIRHLLKSSIDAGRIDFAEA